MKTAQPPLTTYHPGRHLHILDEKSHDPYHNQEKLAEPAACDTCGASYQDGQWTWTTPSLDAVQARCPACRRTDDKQPAGCVTLGGDVVRDHSNDIEILVRGIEHREKAAHPLQRIMSIGVEGDKMQIETTDEHLARSIGDALLSAYKGDFELQYSETEHFLRLSWKR